MKINEALKIIMQYCKGNEGCKSCRFDGYVNICALHRHLPCDWEDLLETEEEN